MPFSMRTLFECVKKKLASASNSLFRRSQARQVLLRGVRQELFSGQPLDFRRLEPRRVLNASFTLVGGDLTLFNFANSPGVPDLTVEYDSAINAYEFTLSSGTWAGAANPLVTVAGGTLTVGQAALTGLLDITSGLGTDVTFRSNFTLAADPIDDIRVDTQGDITNDPGTILNIASLEVTSASVDLGRKVGDSLSIGDLTFNSAGNVFITQQNDMTIVGANSAVDAQLTALGAGSDIAINGAVVATDDLLLVAGGNLTQSAAITADGLGLDIDGTTTLTNAANNVNLLSADSEGTTLYRDANTLTVGEVTVDGTTVTGITTSDDNVRLTVTAGNLFIDEAIGLGAGDLFLDVTGDVSQSANGNIVADRLGLIVDGTTRLQDADNDVVTIAARNGGDTFYVDANALRVDTVTVNDPTALLADRTVTGITTVGSDVKLTVNIGNLVIDESIDLGAGDLFLDVDGDVSQSAAGNIVASGLGLIVNGSTRLQSATNDVVRIAARNVGSTFYVDANALSVGTVTVADVTVPVADRTVTGITTVGTDVKLTVNVGDLDIDRAIDLGAGDLFLDVTGDVNQAVAGNIVASGLGLIVDGTTRLQNANNDVVTLAARNVGATSYVDANALSVGTVTVADATVPVVDRTVTGITTVGNDVKLKVNVGDLDIDRAIDLGAGDLFLDVTGDVNQAVAGNIVASGLGLIVDGTTRLQNANNDVVTLAARNVGATFYVDANALSVGTVTVADATVPVVDRTVTGITTVGNDVKLKVNVGDLDIDQAIDLGAGDLFLDVTGDVNQAVAGNIVASGLGLMVDGITRLQNANNNVVTLAARNVGATSYVDANALSVGTVTVADVTVPVADRTVTGITTVGNDVKLKVNVGDLDIDQAIDLGAGDLFLDVTGDVNQAVAGNIVASGLGLIVDGTTRLQNANNNVVTLAARNVGATFYVDANALSVGTVTVADATVPVADRTVTGITTVGNDVKLKVNLGDLDIDQAIALGAGDLFLDVTGDVNQAVAGNIVASGLGLIVDGATRLQNANNDVVTLAARNVGATSYVDANALSVGTVTVADVTVPVADRTVTGITTVGNDVKLKVNVGDLDIDQAIDLGAGDLFLDVTGDVNQAVAGNIVASGLGLIVDGTTRLQNANNNVVTIGARNGGATFYTDANTLSVGTVTVPDATVPPADQSVTGITTSGSDAKLILNLGDLVINQAIGLGAGDLFLDVAGNVSQTAAITATGLGLDVGGNTTLTNAGNNVSTLAALGGGFIRYTNIGDLNIGTVTVDGDSVDDVVSSGDITIEAAAIIDADTVDSPIDFDIDGVNVTLLATTGGIGSATGDPLCDAVFNLVEVRASGDLKATANNGVVALNAQVIGNTTIAALSGVLQSDGDVDASGLDASAVTNLYLIADADRNGVGVLTINSPLSVVGDLRLQGADIDSGGPLNLQADRILLVSRSAENIQVTTRVLDARAGGNLNVTANGNIQLQDLDCDNVALASTTVAGSVTLTSTGSVTVLDDVISGFDGLATSSTGNIQIFATTDLLVHDAVVSDRGNISLQANNDVRITSALVPEGDDLVVVTTATGTVEISADFNGDSNGAGGEIFMSDGARVIAGRGSVDYVPGIDGNASPTAIVLASSAIRGATVTMSADENVTVGSVQSADDTGAAIQVTSRNGGIIDGGDAGTDFVANFANAVTTLRSVTGIGNGDPLETMLFELDAANAAGTVVPASGDICINEIAAGGDLLIDNANNAAGAVQVQVDAGTLRVLGLGVTTNTGNILLKASQDVIVDASVTATNGGHITLDAGDDVDINAAVRTDVSGDIYVEARNVVNDSVAPQVNGINVDAIVSADQGSVLLRSSRDIRTTAAIDGIRVALDAERNVIQNSNIQTTTGNVAIVTNTGNFNMSSAASILAGGNIAASVAGSIAVGLLRGTDVGLSAGGSISNAIGVGATNVDANNLSMRVGGAIGTSSAAIGTSVATLGTFSTSNLSVFINEVNDVIVGAVPVITASVSGVNRINFKAPASTESGTATVTPVNGITTSGGDVKLTVGGNLTQTEAIIARGLSLQVTGATTLENPANDVTTLAAVNGGVTRFTDINSLEIGTVLAMNGFTTASDVKLTVGSDLTQTRAIEAQGLSLDVTGATTLDNPSNNVTTLAADNGGVTRFTDANNLVIGNVLTMTGITVASDVKLTVGGELTQTETILAQGLSLDVTGTTTLDNANNNVTTLALDNGGVTRFTDVNSLVIGNVLAMTGINTASDVKLTVGGNLTQTEAIAAQGLSLDVNGATTLDNTANDVTTLAVDNGGVTRFTDANSLVIGNVLAMNGITTASDVKLTVVGNLTQTEAIVAGGLALEVDGATTLDNAANNVTTLAADNGGVTRFTDVNSLVIGNVLTMAGVSVANSNVKLTVGGDLSQTERIDVGGLSLKVTGATTLENSANDVATLAADNGGAIRFKDVNDLAIGEVLAIRGITTTSDVVLTASGHIDSLDQLGTSIAIVGRSLTLDVGTYAHLRTKVETLSAVVVSNGSVHNGVDPDSYFNGTANTQGTEFLKTVGSGTSAEYQYRSKYSTNYALYVRNDGDLSLGNITAVSGSAANFYVETVASGNLTINGAIKTISTGNTPGGIVLIAGGNLVQNATGSLEAKASGVDNITKQLGLNPTFFNGGQGPGRTSSEIIYDTFSTISYEANGPEIDNLGLSNDYFQRVMLRFGSAGEQGFVALVGYADGQVSALKTFVTDSGGDFVDRTVRFSSRFLGENPILSTNAVIRRADTFFLFSGGGTNDLTFVASPILNVKSQGIAGGAVVTPEPEVPVPQNAVVPVVAPVIPILTQAPLPQIELPAQIQKPTEVAIYRIDFEGLDKNQNGQIEQAELPTYEIVLQEDTDDDSERIPIVAKNGKTPTQEDIDRAKNLLQNDPNKPAGAYAIIKSDAAGNKSVLDIFSVRDWPEKPSAEQPADADGVEEIKLEPYSPEAVKPSAEGEVVPPPVAKPKDSDTGLFVPTDASGLKPESRFASAGLLLGSLWMLRSSSVKSDQATLNEAPQKNSMSVDSDRVNVDYGMQARRRRQRAR